MSHHRGSQTRDTEDTEKDHKPKKHMNPQISQMSADYN